MLIVQVVAYNRAGLTTTVCSNGFRLDRVGPVIGTISVVEPWRLDDERYGPDGLGSISFTWADFIDLHTRIVRYEIAVGTSAGEADVYGFEPVALELSEFTAYEPAVDATCVDKGLCAAVTLGESTSVDDCAAVSSFGFPCLHTAADAGAGVEESCAVDVASGATAICETAPDATEADAGTCADAGCTFTAYEAAVDATRHTVSQLTMTGGQQYYVSVRAIDLHGNPGVASSDPIIVDGTSPASGAITIDAFGPPDSTGTVFVQAFSRIKVSWASFQDEESGIATYSVGLGTDGCGSDDILKMHSRGLDTLWEVEQLDEQSTITSDTVLVVTVRATNRVGLWADVCSQIKIDDSQPVAGLVFDGAHIAYEISCRTSCKEVDHQQSATSIDAHWGSDIADSDGFTDGESSIVKYEWAVGSGPRPSQQVMEWVDVGLATNASCPPLCAFDEQRNCPKVRAALGRLSALSVFL